MNKQELTVVVVLFLLLIGWMGLQSKLAPAPDPVADPVEAPAGTEPGDTNSVSTNTVVEPRVVPTNEAPVVVEKPEPAVITEPPAGAGRELAPEQVAVLSNAVVEVTVSSRGGAIHQVVLKAYPEKQEEDSDPVLLDFSSHPALLLGGIPSLGTASDYEMVVDASGRSLVMTEATEDGLVLERSLSLGDGYSIKLTDTFKNRGTAPIVVPESSVALGPMKSMLTPGEKRNRYSTTVGLNTFSSVGGTGVVHWEKKGPEGDKESLADRFVPEGQKKKGFGCGGPRLTAPMPALTNVVKTVETEWISAKNRFFIQILAAEEAGAGYTLWVERLVPDEENPDDPRSWARVATLDRAWAELHKGGKTLQPGTELVRRADYFVGPQKFSLLAELGREQDKVMFRAWKNFGWFRAICIGMLRALNWIHGVIPNYGVAIILLTILVRILFWPFTHKSTKSMEKMREIQPEVARLKEKYEKDPQRLQRETMQLYREHGVNPMASCLPMVFQMPVFIGLFIVLRSAVELRFEGFLWIRDLSEPEGLLPGLPVIGELNILPLLMTATMILQQKLTPQAGDAQQQKMMMFFMPLFLLYIMYSMPSALTLYWTVSQVLAVSQLLLQRRKKAQAAPAPA